MRNAVESPLLRLTPEIRVRIYDFVFGSTPVHIRSADSIEVEEDNRHYRLLRCAHPREHVETPLRYVERVNVPRRTRIPGCTIRHDDYGEPLSGVDINLGLLLVSRQIYHEAVLKPFSEIPFYHVIHWVHDGVLGLGGFVDDLAPPQLKALKRMRIILEHAYSDTIHDTRKALRFGHLPDKTVMRKFTGLKDLEIVLSPELWDELEATTYLDRLDEHFNPDHAYHSQSIAWLQILPELRLKSLRVTIEADHGQVGMYESSRCFPTFTSKGQVETIKNWLRQAELNLQFGKDVIRDGEPVPFGHRQIDDAISTPSWATPEEIKK